MDEYWGDDGEAPQWRIDKHIGTEIRGKGYGTEVINMMFELAFGKYEMNYIAIGVVGKMWKR